MPMDMDMMDKGGGGGDRGGGMGMGMMDEESRDEKPRVFLSKADLGGRTCKAGDNLTLKVTDVDPESGDVEAEITDYGSGGTDENTPGYMADFDKAMPEDKESEAE